VDGGAEIADFRRRSAMRNFGATRRIGRKKAQKAHKK
jgi:hypothetical protein